MGDKRALAGSNHYATSATTPYCPQETSKQNSQLQDSVAEMQQRLREQESLYVSRLAALENERRRCEQQVTASRVVAVGTSAK